MHIPVLLKEVIEILNPQKNENFIDCNLGEAGHILEILKRTKPEGKILGIELDEETIKKAKEKLIGFEDRIVIENDNFRNLKEIVQKNDFKNVSGILFDLGMSSGSLEESGRGFSFLRNEPLMMNYGNDVLILAKDILNKWSEKDLEKIFKEYGEERFSYRIAKEIVRSRKEKNIETTFDLVEIVKRVVPKKFQFMKIHPATKIFQALRIEVNDELENLKEGLESSLEILNSGGKIVVISFHSLEDRIVKNFFRDNKERLEILTKKPITPSEEEIERNIRSRSAKLRAVIKK
jgi:16S rRNA (cytosine1402-N4)-methyltransferase